ncbi:hypothetical protein AALA17_08260 [Lactobacillaceae bacterium 24-114]
MGELENLKNDCIIKQKRGIHIIIAAILVWSGILVVELLTIPVLTKNLLIFICSALLLPISYSISQLIKVDFQNKTNPLTKLGMLFSMNQLLYLLIAMWIYPTIPDKMLMVLAIIFGAHLLPYSWLYNSRAYLVSSIIISLLAFFVGLNFKPITLASVMLILVVSFCIALILENHCTISKNVPGKR